LRGVPQPWASAQHDRTVKNGDGAENPGPAPTLPGPRPILPRRQASNCSPTIFHPGPARIPRVSFVQIFFQCGSTPG